jgi:hypothetical protein
MKCRSCNSLNTKVTVTKHKLTETWRYCRCLDCNSRYKTIETYVIAKPGPRFGSKTGTKVCGSAHPNSVLTEADVIKLRDMYQKGTRQVELVKIFGIEKTTVYKIVHRKNWTHV